MPGGHVHVRRRAAGERSIQVAESTRPSSANGYVVSEDEFERLQLGYAEDGVIGHPSDTAVVYADSTGRQYKVRLGKRAIVRGRLWQSDLSADATVTTTTNTSGNPRIDRAVLRLTRSTGLVEVKTLIGTPAASPSAPALTQGLGPGGTFEFPLARWTVINNYTTVAAGDIITEAWYPQPTGRIFCTSTSRPQGVAAKNGTLIFETDTSLKYGYNGTKWLRDYTTVFKTADETNSTTTLNDDDHLKFTGEANATYVFDMQLFIFGDSGTDLRVGWNLPSGATIKWTGSPSQPVTATQADSDTWHGSTTQAQPGWQFGLLTNPNHNIARVWGYVALGSTAGVVNFMFAQGTASASGSTIEQGSSLTYKQVA